VSLNEEFGRTASTTHVDIPKVEHHPSTDPSEEVKFIWPFVAPELSCETECPLSPLLEPKPCPSGHQNVDLDNDEDSTLPLHDISPKNKNCCAMDNLRAPTLEVKKNNSTNKHEGFPFETPKVSCSLLESLQLITLSATRLYEDHNHLLVLVFKLFRRMVVDAFIYHKYYKSRSGIIVLTL